MRVLVEQGPEPKQRTDLNGEHVVPNIHRGDLCDDCAVREDQLRGTGARTERTRRVRSALEGFLRNHGERAGNPWRRSR